MNLILAKVAYSLTDKLISEFIDSEPEVNEDKVLTCCDFESRLVNWLDANIDIPFVSDEHEKEVFEAVISGVKSIILMKLK